MSGSANHCRTRQVSRDSFGHAVQSRSDAREMPSMLSNGCLEPFHVLLDSVTLRFSHRQRRQVFPIRPTEEHLMLRPGYEFWRGKLSSL